MEDVSFIQNFHKSRYNELCLKEEEYLKKYNCITQSTSQKCKLYINLYNECIKIKKNKSKKNKLN